VRPSATNKASNSEGNFHTQEVEEKAKSKSKPDSASGKKTSLLALSEATGVRIPKILKSSSCTPLVPNTLIKPVTPGYFAKTSK